jgi:EmrB/QacA subfamily drug resistance transporter
MGIGSRTINSSPRCGSDAALAVIGACQFMMVLDNTVVTIALPQIQRGLHFDDQSLAWVMNSYVLAFGGLMLLGGRVGDILGRRFVFIASTIAFTIASFLCGVSTNAVFLLVARTVQGVSAAFASPAALALVAATFEGERRARAFAIYAAISSIGWAAGMIIGGLMTSWLSWRWAFFMNIPLGITIATAAPHHIPETPTKPRQLDVAGAFTSTLGVAALAYSFIHIAASGSLGTHGITAMAAALLLLTVFVLIERRVAQPVTPIHLFANRRRSSAYLARMCINGSMMGMFFYLTQFLQRVLEYDALQTGLAFVPVAISMLLATRIAAAVVTQVGHKWPAVAAAATVGFAMLWLSHASTTVHLSGILGALVLSGLGMGLAFVVLTILAMEDVPADDTGAASGLVTATQQLGGALGLSLMVTAFGLTLRSERAESAGVFGQGMCAALIVASMLAFLAAGILIIGARGALQTREDRRVRGEP